MRGSLALPAADSFLSLTVVRGSCTLAGGGTSLALPCGATVLVPAGSRCTLEGEEALLVGAAPTV